MSLKVCEMDHNCLKPLIETHSRILTTFVRFLAGFKVEWTNFADGCHPLWADWLGKCVTSPLWPTCHSPLWQGTRRSCGTSLLPCFPHSWDVLFFMVVSIKHPGKCCASPSPYWIWALLWQWGLCWLSFLASVCYPWMTAGTLSGPAF